MKRVQLYYLFCLIAVSSTCFSQKQADTSLKMPMYKNVIRYNLSGALVFGIDKYIVFGYERVLSPRRSFSINVGLVSMPSFISVITDSFEIQKDKKKTGYNFSADYRFYLAKENKHAIPHGIYIGPYYSFNRFEGENNWLHKNPGGGGNDLTTTTTFNVHAFGFELGYQFVLWKRMTLDLVMVGPGLGIYKYKAKFDGNLDVDDKEQVLYALKQLLIEKYPGMNVVFEGKEMDANGVLQRSTIGYRYIIHIGFLF